MKPNQTAETDLTPWLDLSPAARRLGVHFTTLRRWADRGQIDCIRTPGGRRRFSPTVLDQFAAGLRQSSRVSLPAPNTPPPSAELSHLSLRGTGMQSEAWYGRLDDAQRYSFRSTGQLLLGLLMQYTHRGAAGQPYLREAERLARDYGATCARAGMPVTETVQAFLFFRHAIAGLLVETSLPEQGSQTSALQLYRQSDTFFDALLLATLAGYST